MCGQAGFWERAKERGRKREKTDEWTRRVSSFFTRKKHTPGRVRKCSSWWRLAGKRNAEGFRRLCIAGEAPWPFGVSSGSFSLLPLLSFISLRAQRSVPVWRRSWLAPQRPADTMGRERQSGTLRVAILLLQPSRCSRSCRSAPLWRPPDPGIQAHRDAEGPRGGRAHLTIQVPGHFPGATALQADRWGGQMECWDIPSQHPVRAHPKIRRVYSKRSRRPAPSKEKGEEEERRDIPIRLEEEEVARDVGQFWSSPGFSWFFK